MSTENNAKIIWNYFSQLGWSKQAIAGILGNMEIESNIIPDINEISGGSGYGLVQWTPGSKLKNWAIQNNLDYKKIDTQLRRLEYEVTHNIDFHYSMTFKQFTQLTASPERMAEIFCDGYERPNKAYKKLTQRQTSARKWYNYFTQGTHASTPTPPSQSSTYYTIVAGDTLWKIAQKFNTTVAELVKLNQFPHQNVTLHIGQHLLIKKGQNTPQPPTPTPPSQPSTYYTIVAGDTLWKIAQKFNTTVAELVKLNQFPHQNVTLHIGQQLLVKKGQNTPQPPTPTPPSQPNSETVTSEYAESGQFTANRSLAIRNQPNEASPAVATLNSGEKVTYDRVYLTTHFVYISYISYSGTRRYIAIRTFHNQQHGPIWGTIV